MIEVGHGQLDAPLLDEAAEQVEKRDGIAAARHRDQHVRASGRRAARGTMERDSRRRRSSARQPTLRDHREILAARIQRPVPRARHLTRATAQAATSTRLAAARSRERASRQRRAWPAKRPPQTP